MLRDGRAVAPDNITGEPLGKKTEVSSVSDVGSPVAEKDDIREERDCRDEVSAITEDVGVTGVVGAKVLLESDEILGGCPSGLLGVWEAAAPALVAVLDVKWFMHEWLIYSSQCNPEG